MWNILKLALNNADIKSEATRSLRDQVLTVHKKPGNAKVLLETLIHDKLKNNCSMCDSRHFCSLFLSCIHYALNDTEEMRLEIRVAIKDAQRIGSKWNELLARWVYGVFLKTQGEPLASRRELEKAKEMLMEVADRHHKEHRYEERDKCNKFIASINYTLEKTYEVNVIRNTQQENLPNTKIKKKKTASLAT